MSSGRMPVLTAPQAAELALDAQTLERLTGGTWIGTERQVVIRGAAIDSRAVTHGCLFACLAGARVDGHDYAATAVGDGAALVLASRAVNVPVPVVLVSDVAVALAAIAGEFRRRYDPSCTWIGIGGANGKTTTKELIAAACVAAAPERVHATRGNLNNHLGVPLTVLATPPGMRYCVIELGANHPGEVTALAAVAKPQVGVVVSIGPEHLEGFGDLAGVARAECELFAALPPQAPALVGLTGMAEHVAAHGTTVAALLDIIRISATGRSLVLIGGEGAGHVPVNGTLKAEAIEAQLDGVPVHMPLLGQHNLANATLAYRTAVAAGIAPAIARDGLRRVRPVAGRLVPRHVGAHLILDDSYNANPASMAAGLAVLAQQSGQRVAVLGAMGELGDASDAAHARVGALAASHGLPLITVGAAAQRIGEGYRSAGGSAWNHASDHAGAVALVRGVLAQGPSTVLVKASRSAALDQVVRGLLEGVQS
ncbi:MAG: UDP-N-acetylmuramoyl-tripeptide--D-alanyl-D-alanine ligase [Planctomycetes bacterium]|nr:UDP-N-acetylmuramoyl-tripeptide--D-alanyl-D-alanine ligase [Planctomycetota bacterium]